VVLSFWAFEKVKFYNAWHLVEITVSETWSQTPTPIREREGADSTTSHKPPGDAADNTRQLQPRNVGHYEVGALHRCTTDRPLASDACDQSQDGAAHREDRFGGRY
jgi:hypothetical protein